MTMTDAGGELPAPPPTTGANILASKVSRALEVRTDTAAMKAALEALSQLPSEDVVDSRSVRVAIEQDALHQAMLMQEELQKLVNVVSQLRQGVTETASIANRVCAAIDSSVVTTMAMPSSEEKEEQEHGTTTFTGKTIMSPEEALEQEQQLAAQLSDAFRERDEAARRAEAVNEFLNKFDLSEQDSRLLDHYAFEDMEKDGSSKSGMAFLDALERVRRIRKELGKTFGTTTSTSGSLNATQQETLLEGASYLKPSDAQRLGATSAIRMMESLASKQERAYERLYHWLQKHLHLNTAGHVPTSSSQQQQTRLDQDDIDESLSHPFVRRSLQVLRHVPAFYSHTLELIATCRRSEETRRFLLALTSGYDGMPPIEMKAHDPVNYIGDMLACVFRSFSVEADVARGLVQYKSDQEDATEDDTVAADQEDSDLLGLEKPMSATDILAQSMSGVSRPLKSRVLQVIASLARRPDEDGDDDENVHDANLDSMEEEGSVARSRVSSLYSICGLLLFYHSALCKAVHKLASATNESLDDSEKILKSPLVTVIMECLEEASTAYAASMKVYGAMLESLTMILGDSEASLAHLMVTKICEVRMASPGFSMDVSCPSSIESSLSLEFVCETLVEAALSSCKSLDDAVTLKVSVTTAKKAGLSESDAVRFNDLISAKEQIMIDELVESETKEVLDLCGLGSIWVAWTRMQQVYVEGMTMATHPGLSPEDVEPSMKEFYSSLYSPPLPSYDGIKDPILRRRARSKIAENVASTYAELYEAMMSDKGGYDDLSFLGHTPSQVKTLFSV